jgi:excisionase family DNA binding protein
MVRRTLSIMKACEVVSVSERTIYRWLSAGKVEYVRRHAQDGRTDRVNRPSPANQPGAGPSQSAPADLQRLFHRLNNQLGIILAHVELLEAKAADEGARARAAQMVSSVLHAIGTAREIRRTTEPSER